MQPVEQKEREQHAAPWIERYRGSLIWGAVIAAVIIIGQFTPIRPVRDFFGNFNWLTEQSLRLARDLFESHGELTVFLAPLLENTIFLGAIIPGTLIMLLAGLAALPDVDDALLRGLEPYFTTQPFYPRLSESGVNPNTAPAHVLSLIYRGSPGDKQLLDQDAIFSILRARQEDRIFCPTAGEEPCVSFESEIGRVGETVFPPLGYVGHVFAGRSVAAFGEARACIETTIDRREPSEPKTLTYRTDC